MEGEKDISENIDVDENVKSEPVAQSENIDQAIIQQIQDIEKEVAECSSLIGDLEDISCLKTEYASDDAVYQSKLEALSSQYNKIRKTRGDGNCFFRSFGFGCIEYFLRDKEALKRFISFSEQTKDELIKLGYPNYTVEDFYETFLDILEMINKGSTKEEMLNVFRDQPLSDYFVVYLRLMVSNYLQNNSDFYGAFIEGEGTMKDFCSHEVEPMAKESDHIHIIALTNAAGICVRVVYMDRGGAVPINHHDFPEDGSKPQLFLLYSPGHYNILYPVQQETAEEKP